MGMLLLPVLHIVNTTGLKLHCVLQCFANVKQVDNALQFQEFTSEDICFLSWLYLG